MTEQLFSVGIQHIKTGERINLEVWAKNVNEATMGLEGVISWNTQSTPISLTGKRGSRRALLKSCWPVELWWI